MVKIDSVSRQRITLTKLLPFVILWLLIPLITQPNLLSSLRSSEQTKQFEVQGTAKSMPLAFVPYESFIDTPAGFSVRSLGGTLFFTQAGVDFSLPYYPEGSKHSASLANALSIRFDGANPYSTIEGIDPMVGTISDFTGNDPTQWQTDLPTFAGITYFDLYPGIDLYYDGPQGRLKSTYVVAPNADPSRIVWSYAGADEVRIDAQTGDLLVSLVLDESEERYQLREQAPVAWQDIHGRQVPVEAEYAITGQHITFSLGDYNPAYGLRIF
ncbi:MAG: hypothetical protein KDJ52_27800 [Anaerolineae bacterium]|nr:hypothetical protein [Anaerolineae bacterium]